MGIAVSSCAATLARIAAARDVRLGAYVLAAGAMRDALAAAARRGARVRVTLQADPYGDARGGKAAANAAAARVLRAAGARVRLVPRERESFHCKAAVCDGVAFLDDRNWPAADGLVVRDDDPRDVALVRAALDGRGGADRALATRKDVALAREAELIADAPAGTAVLVATESFGAGPVADALRARAARGDRCTLVLDSRELDPRRRAVVAALAAAGVRVRASTAGEKFVLAGGAAWIGSANATGTRGPRGIQIDWGMVTRDPALVDALRRFAGIAAGAN